jgi:uncharacterized protein YcgI (DUF1989 family)
MDGGRDGDPPGTPVGGGFTSRELIVPARRAEAIRLARGDLVTVFNDQGQQVVDTWAFDAENIHQRMSMEHTRASLLKIVPETGDSLYSNYRQPILKLIEDTSPGVYDTLMPSCDRDRYEQLGCIDYHDNCADNLVDAMREIGFDVVDIPSPFNILMNVPVGSELDLAFEEPLSRPGDFVKLRAERDVIMVFSSCPQDILPVNGRDRVPVEVRIRIESSSGER